MNAMVRRAVCTAPLTLRKGRVKMIHLIETALDRISPCISIVASLYVHGVKHIEELALRRQDLIGRFRI